MTAINSNSASSHLGVALGASGGGASASSSAGAAGSAGFGGSADSGATGVKRPGDGPSGRGASPILPPLFDDSLAPASWKAVYTIVERGLNKRHFVRIGIAFVNRDGSLNVKLDAVPVNGQLHIRDSPPRDGRDGADPFVADRERPRNREVIAPF